MNNEKMTDEDMLEERIKGFLGGIAFLVGIILLVTGVCGSIFLFVVAYGIGTAAYIDFIAIYVGEEAAGLIYIGVTFINLLLWWIIMMYNMSDFGKITKIFLWFIVIVITPYNIGLLIHIVKPVILYLVYLFSL